MANTKATRITIDIDPEDMKTLQAIKRKIEEGIGRVSMAAAIRAAIRMASSTKTAKEK